MTNYTNVLNCEYQRVKRQAQESVSRSARWRHVIAITKSQLNRLMKAYETKKGMTMKISKTQLTYHMKIEGGFLPMLVGFIQFLLGTVLPGWRIIWTRKYGCSKTN